jgi:Thioredoxin
MQGIESKAQRAQRAWLNPSWLPLLLLSLPGLGCKEGRSEASVITPVGRPEDCKVFVDRVCAMTGSKAPTCDAVKHLVPMFTDASCAINLQNFSVVQQKYHENRKPCEQLTAGVCEQTGATSGPCNAVKEQVVAIDAPECETLLGRLDGVVQNLRLQDIATRPLDLELQKQIADGNAPGFGPKDARVTLVLFSDFECPFCARAARTIGEVRAKYSDRVRMVFRNMPLPNHPNARPAALAALAANE